MICLDSNEDMIKYLSKLKEGDRVIETDGCMRGRAGTVYISENGGGKCVMWDKRDDEEGQMGTSVTGGTRLLEDMLRDAVEKFETNYTIALKASLDGIPEEYHKDILTSIVPVREMVTRKRKSFLIQPGHMLSRKEVDEAVAKINAEIEAEMKSEEWAKCDECDVLIPLDDFESGKAKRELVQPDSHFGGEEYETLCKHHNEVEQTGCSHAPVIGGRNDDGYIICRRCGNFIEYNEHTETYHLREVEFIPRPDCKAPDCKSCGDNYNMMWSTHTGEWVCHATHAL